MTPVQGTYPGLAHKLGTVGCLCAYIFFLYLIHLFMGVTDCRICTGLDRAHRQSPLHMGALGFDLLFKFQAFCGLARIGIRRCLHPQLTAGWQTFLRLLQLFRCPLGLSSGMSEFFIRCFRWQFVSSKFQLRRPLRFSLGCPRLFLLWFLGLRRLLKTLLILIAILVHPAPAFCLARAIRTSYILLRWGIRNGLPILIIPAYRAFLPETFLSGIFPSEIPLPEISPRQFRCRSTRHIRSLCRSIAGISA